MIVSLTNPADLPIRIEIRRDAYEILHNDNSRAVCTHHDGDAGRCRRRCRPMASAGCATGGGPGGGGACAIYDGGVLSAVGMRQSLLPPSSSVDVPITRPRDRRASSKKQKRRRGRCVNNTPPVFPSPD